MSSPNMNRLQQGIAARAYVHGGGRQLRRDLNGSLSISPKYLYLLPFIRLKDSGGRMVIGIGATDGNHRGFRMRAADPFRLQGASSAMMGDLDDAGVKPRIGVLQPGNRVHFDVRREEKRVWTTV